MKISNNLQKYISYLRKETEEKVINLLKREANSSVKCKAGDIIETSADVGKVKSTKIYIDPQNFTYSIVYSCEKLTRNRKPFKVNKTIKINQEHIRELYVI